MFTKLFVNKILINTCVVKRKLSHIHTDTKKLNPEIKTSTNSNPNTNANTNSNPDIKYSMILTELDEIKEDLGLIKLFGGLAWFIGCIVLYNSGNKNYYHKYKPN